MRVIGINDGHNASCVYMENGIIKFALQEERLSREKNQEGFPILALNYLRDKEGLDFENLDSFAIASNYVPLSPTGREARIHAYKRDGAVNCLKRIAKKMGAKQVRDSLYKKKRRVKARAMGIPEGKISFLDHHLCHAASAYYGWGRFDEKILVLTNDGAGDDLCATASVGENGKLSRIASVHMNHSIGELWALFTAMMGMVPLEHEYKLMGLAPYAPVSGMQRVRKVFEDYFSFTEDGLGWYVNPGRPPIPYAYKYFRKAMEFMRFDWIAAGLQSFTEEFLCQWIKNAVRKTGIRKVALAGGTFMNVKANQRINEMEEVEELFIFPSCGDETLPFGAVYYVNAHQGFRNEPLGSLYLGIFYTDDEIKEKYDAYSFKSKYKITAVDNIAERAANLIADGKIIAWFQGREEFGARALGARSILADPTKANVIKEINEMIKSRDFWMPFASSMLESGARRYLVNPKKIPSPYMILTFDTTSQANEIEGGRHPYDHTCRPQVVNQNWNPLYHELLTIFYRLTGRHGILNTSFNLHGLPIASSAEDAFHVLENSGLRFLATGNWLIEKVD